MNIRKVVIVASLAVVLVGVTVYGTFAYLSRSPVSVVNDGAPWTTILTMDNADPNLHEQNSGLFVARGNLRINYTCTYQALQVIPATQNEPATMYDAVNSIGFTFWKPAHFLTPYSSVMTDTTTPDCPVNVKQPLTSGTLSVSVSGTTYLQIDSLAPWSVQVQEQD